MDYSGITDLFTDWPSFSIQTCLPPAGVSADSLFLWILWSLWRARNSFFFDGFSTTPEDTLSTAIKLAREWSRDSKTETLQPTRKSRQEVVEEPGVVVVRSDAAWCARRNVAGLGWTVLAPQEQNHQQHREFVGSPLMAESLALREAVLTCRRMEMQHLRFESDSSQLMTQLMTCVNSGSGSAEIHVIVSDILKLVSAFESILFVWIPRDRNFVADRLAKAALVVAEPLVIVDALNAPN